MREQLQRGEEWPILAELVSQLIEEVSILAAEYRRKKPREIPRPKQTPGSGGGAQGQDPGGFKRAVETLRRHVGAVHHK